MATDARLSVGLAQHPKTRKLIKRLGQGAAWSLVCLILWTASNRSDGSLAGMSAEDIELAADWQGEDGEFVKALTDVRFLDEEGGQYRMHDWAEHNPWAAGAEQRSAKARWNAAKRHHGVAEADRLVPEYAAIRNAASNASSTAPAQDQQQSSNAPSPSPSPIPAYPSSLRSEGRGNAPAAQTPPPQPPKPEKPKREQTTLAVYLAACKAKGVKPIPLDHPLHQRCADVGITSEMLQLAWLQFKRKYTTEAGSQAKRYKDWPGHFANSVFGRWGVVKLWHFAGESGQAEWTNDGLAFKRAEESRLHREVEHA